MWIPPASRSLSSSLQVPLLLLGINTESYRRFETNNSDRKEKEVISFSLAHGNFIDHLLYYIHCVIYRDFSFYLASHQDQNSNKALLTSTTKLTLF